MTDNIKNEKNSKSEKIIILVIAVVLLAAVTAAGFLIQSHSSTPNNSSSESLQAQDNSDSAEDFMISTPVGDLKYPAQWSRNVKLKVTSEKNPYSAELYGVVGKTEIQLFTIHIGKDGQGYLFGTAPDENGDMAEIRIDVKEISRPDSCSDEEMQQLYAMQDRVNDIIEQIYLLDGFEGASDGY